MKQSANGLIFTDVLPPGRGVSGWSAGFYLRSGKRLSDIALVIVSLPVTLPLILGLALLISCQGGAPFYGQWRVGRQGRAFKCWKLRSMVRDAEARLKTLLEEAPEARLEWEESFKLREDPRITPLGQILRRSSLDELPQILNILRGEMSCVGPRPVTKAEARFYGADLDLCQQMRPGLTGLWQVSGRNELGYAERVALDLHYLRRCSVRLDLMILIRTVRAVLSGSGR